MRGHQAFLSPLTPFLRQTGPCCRARPRGRGMELSTAPMAAGTAQGPGRSRLSGVRVSGSAHTTTEGAPSKQVQRRPGQDLPGAFPFPFPVPIPRQAREAEPSGSGTTRGKGCPHLPQPHLPGHRPGVYETSLLEKPQECSFLLDFPHPSEQALFMCSLGFLGNEQPPAESPTPPVLCYCSCQVLNVAVVVTVTTPSHFGFN